MNKSTQVPPTDQLAPRAEDIDPWSEFLSESDEAELSLRSVPPTTDSSPAADLPAPALDLHPPAASGPVPAARSSSKPSEPIDDLAIAPPTMPPAFESPPAFWTPADAADVRLTETRRFVPSQPPADVSESQVMPAPFSAPDPPAADHERTVSSSAPVPVVEAKGTAPPQHGPVPRGPATPAAIDKGPSVSLAQLTGRQVPVHWSEAVATIEELCSELIGLQIRLIPEMADVAITAEGTVIVRAAKRGDRDPRSLGRMLHALLSSSSTPLPLRLFVTSSISSDRFHSIELFADALSHYGMPHRAALIQALYRRSVEVLATAARPVVAARAKSRTTGRARVTRSRLLVAAIAIAAGAICATGASFWLWRSASKSGSEAAPAVEAVAPTPNEVAQATRGPAPVEASRPRDDWRLGAIVVPPARVEREARVVPVVESHAPVARLVPPPPVPSAREAAARPRLAARTPAVPITTVPPPPVFDPTIYSKDDADVQPPVVLASQLPSLPETPGETGARVTNVVEFIVDEGGEVLKVSFLNRPSRLPDMGTLSALKLLKFRPARRNGLPVRYKLLMDLKASPG